jgi:hypothetical protein
MVMRTWTRVSGAALMAALLSLVMAAPVGSQAQAPPPQQPTFRVNVDLVTLDVIPRPVNTSPFEAL